LAAITTSVASSPTLAAARFAGAFRAGAGFNWDAENLKASLPKAQEFVSKEYRKGFEVVGLNG
jgi:hypothetical protein